MISNEKTSSQGEKYYNYSKLMEGKNGKEALSI